MRPVDILPDQSARIFRSVAEDKGVNKDRSRGMGGDMKGHQRSTGQLIAPGIQA